MSTERPSKSQLHASCMKPNCIGSCQQEAVHAFQLLEGGQRCSCTNTNSWVLREHRCVLLLLTAPLEVKKEQKNHRSEKNKRQENKHSTKSESGLVEFWIRVNSRRAKNCGELIVADLNNALERNLILLHLNHVTQRGRFPRMRAAYSAARCAARLDVGPPFWKEALNKNECRRFQQNLVSQLSSCFHPALRPRR